MPKYKVIWSKAYYVEGTTEIEATTSGMAYEKMSEIIGNKTGPMQYCPEDDFIEVLEDD